MKQRVTNDDELILSIDAGTQSIRAAFIDLTGRIRDIVKTPIEPYFSRHPGWAEQEPEYYWQMLCRTCRELRAKAAVPDERMLGVTLTTQRNTLVNVDREGQALRPAIVWLDSRKADASRTIPFPLRLILKTAGLFDFIQAAVQDCESNWIRQNQPEIWEKTHKYLFLSGFFTHRLTGRFADSVGNMFGYIPFDVKSGRWARELDMKWRLFPLEKDKLPELAKPTETLGRITRKASEETGIPEGLPLVAAASDRACEILGAGCLGPHSACVTFGTTATVDTPNDRYVQIKPLWPPYPAAIPDQYYTEVAVLRGFWMVTWFKEEFGLQEKIEALEKGVAVEQLFDRLIRDIPPGSMGLVLQPYWTPGPDVAQFAKGSVIGFGDVHTRAHLYRAIIEGLVFALKEGSQLLEKRNQVQISQVRISGGGSQSDTVMQIAADILGIPAERPHTSETSAVGAAIDGAVGLRLFSDFSSAVKEMARVEKVFEPIKENHRVYLELYQRVYTRIYKRLLPLFEEIQAITRYPE